MHPRRAAPLYYRTAMTCAESWGCGRWSGLLSAEAETRHTGRRIEIGVENDRRASGCRVERTRCKSDRQTKCVVRDLNTGVDEVRGTRDAYIGDGRPVANRIGRLTVKSNSGGSTQRRKRTSAIARTPTTTAPTRRTFVVRSNALTSRRNKGERRAHYSSGAHVVSVPPDRGGAPLQTFRTSLGLGRLVSEL
jgi:hypothetical protein